MLENEKKILKELQEKFQISEWPGVEVDNYYEGHKRNFVSEEEKEAFEVQLLENFQPVGYASERLEEYSEDGCLEDICWEYFEYSHPDWDMFDYEQSLCLVERAGGEFRALPTVEYMDSGKVLFVAQSQIETLRQNPWICKIDRGGKVVYVGIDTVSELTIIPDERLQARAKVVSPMVS